jgi:hypothetical protein
VYSVPESCRQAAVSQLLRGGCVLIMRLYMRARTRIRVFMVVSFVCFTLVKCLCDMCLLSHFHYLKLRTGQKLANIDRSVPTSGHSHSNGTTELSP